MNPQSVSSARCTIVLVEDAMTFNITFFMFLIANIPMQTSPLTIHYFRKKIFTQCSKLKVEMQLLEHMKINEISKITHEN
jgi:hypothetical protein